MLRIKSSGTPEPATNRLGIRTQTPTPGSPASPAERRDAGLIIPSTDLWQSETRRAGCVETRLSGSTEAAASKASTVHPPRTIRSFYPMSIPPRIEPGRPGQTRGSGPIRGRRPRAVMLEMVRRRSGHRARTPRNPSRGVRGHAPRSTRAAVGSSSAAMRATGQETMPGDRPKRPAVKSSTMKGPRGLGGESRRRRCRTA